MARPIIVIGAGGHGRVCLDLLRALGTPAQGVVDTDPAKKGTWLLGAEILGGDERVTQRSPEQIYLVNGVGTVGSTEIRRRVYEKFKGQGYEFLTLVHPSAIVGAEVQLGEGAQVMAGAVVQSGAALGANCIINTQASVDHDCRIGNHVHVAPGAILCGGVVVGEGAHIGAGAVLIQNLKVGEETMVGAGSAVVTDLPARVRALGIPAKY